MRVRESRNIFPPYAGYTDTYNTPTLRESIMIPSGQVMLPYNYFYLVDGFSSGEAKTAAQHGKVGHKRRFSVVNHTSSPNEDGLD